MTQTNNRIREEWYEYLRSIIKNRDYIPEDAIDGAGDWWLSKIDELLKSQREEIEKAFGGCKKCYGKGYATEKTGHSGRIGINGKRESWVIDNINPCSCDRGKQIINLIKEYKK